ncbi:MAG: helix-turn-helix transcriptional regulator [Bacteroidota bacterium]
MDKAKTLLWSTEKSISEITYDLGFEHPSHFTKLFKNRTGVSPRQFRTQNYKIILSCVWPSMPAGLGCYKDTSKQTQ